MVGRAGERGATYLAVIIGVAVVSSVLAASAQVISHALQRDRERHMLWVGEQYRRALVSYSRFPRGIDTFPKELADLVEDRRNPVVQRHLRRLYFDPLTGSQEWGIVRNPQQRIIGVYSTATRKPIKSAGFAKHYAVFAEAESYADWRFGVGVLLPPRANALAEGDESDASPIADGELRAPLPGEMSDVASILEGRQPGGAPAPGKPGDPLPAGTAPGEQPSPDGDDPGKPSATEAATPAPGGGAEAPVETELPFEAPEEFRGVTIDAPVQAQ